GRTNDVPPATSAKVRPVGAVIAMSVMPRDALNHDALVSFMARTSMSRSTPSESGAYPTTTLLGTSGSLGAPVTVLQRSRSYESIAERSVEPTASPPTTSRELENACATSG